MKYIKMIFISSLTFLSILGTTSFASVSITTEEADQILNYFAENLNWSISGTATESMFEDARTTLQNYDRDLFKTKFNETFETLTLGDFDFNNLSAVGYISYSTYYPQIKFFISNNSFSSSLDYIYYERTSSNNRNWLIGYNPNTGAETNNTVKAFNFAFRTDLIEVTETYAANTIRFNGAGATFDNAQIFIDTYLSFSPSQVIYYKDTTDTTTEITSFFNANYINLVPPIDIPDEPESGDSEGSGEGSDETTPNYSQDLDEIKNELGNINENINKVEQAIPTSGEIAGATEQGNQNFWGNKDEMSEDDYENQIQQGIDDSMEQITDELEQNEVFSSIAIAEQKIIDLFLEEPEDFKISWQDVNYLERTLIPAGEVNFSKICRDNEALGRVKTTLNIIVSAMISLSLFKYIFNLIMVTLGIDHPLILEGEKDDITEISSTKIGNKTYVTKKTYKSNKKGGR